MILDWQALVQGGLIVALFMAALFFVRYWRKSRDRLFLHLAVAFALFSLNRLLLAFVGMDSDIRSYLYLVRSAGFLIILWAIFEKNRPPRRTEEEKGAGGS